MKENNYTICTYNQMFFTEKSKDNPINISFWEKITDLQDFYQEERLTIRRVLRHNKRTNCFYEDVLFESESPKLLKQANEIYRDFYHATPLELYHDTPEIVAELMGQVWH